MAENIQEDSRVVRLKNFIDEYNMTEEDSRLAQLKKFVDDMTEEDWLGK